MIRDDMKRQDQVFLYYSSTAVPGIVAVMEVVKEGYPDKTAFDRKDDHYDPQSDPAKPRWFVVDVRLKRRLARVITLEELRKHAAKELNGMVLLRPGNRFVSHARRSRSLEVHPVARDPHVSHLSLLTRMQFTSSVPSTLSFSCNLISHLYTPTSD